MEKEQYLSEIYKNASNCLDGVEHRISWLSCERDRICLSVIAEDLESLVQECEFYLLSNPLVKSLDIISIKSRYETVIEELEELVS